VGTGTGPYRDCRSTQCCVAVWSRWLESVTRRVGFRALKKALEAPYTAKVNNRVRTSRGTTQLCGGEYFTLKLCPRDRASPYSISQYSVLCTVRYTVMIIID